MPPTKTGGVSLSVTVWRKLTQKLFVKMDIVESLTTSLIAPMEMQQEI